MKREMQQFFRIFKDMKNLNRQGIEKSCSTDDHVRVPEELVFEILLRLPVESLIRFKIISKDWYNLITSPIFIDKHFGNNNCTRILTTQYLQTPGRLFEVIFAIFSYESLTRLHRDFDYLSTPFYLEIVLGPVNGLFMVGHGRSGKYRLALLNPATRELRILPDLASSSCVLGFGFGRDPLTNDFKVVAFWDNHGGDGRIYGPINMAVYSLVSDSWKHLSPYTGNFTYSPPFYGCGALYLNGACYWLSSEDYSIVSFNFGGEVIREIDWPQNTLDSDYDDASLFLYNFESLAMFICRHDNTSRDRDIASVDILLMKEEGCWTKHLTIDVSLLHLLKPLGVWEDKLLLEIVDMYDRYGEFNMRRVVTTKMVLYDPTTHEIKELKIQPDDYNLGNFFIYNESLISLKGSRNNDKSISDLFQDYCTLQSPKSRCEECGMTDHDSRCTCGNDLVKEEDDLFEEEDDLVEEEDDQGQNSSRVFFSVPFLFILFVSFCFCLAFLKKWV